MSPAATATHHPLRVALLFGGRSGEHGISCVTAGGIMAAIDRSRFEPVPVGITKDGRWTLASEDPALWQLQDGRLPQVPGDGPLVIPPQAAGSNEWYWVDGGDPCMHKLRPLGHIDVVFPLLHGPFGEDGTVQGALELTDARYVGAGVLASALGMDKGYMKAVLEAQGLPVAPYVVITPAEWREHPEGATERALTLGLPLFVKPCRAGSSLGITKVERVQDLAPAIVEASRHDPRVLVEAMVHGREVECAVLGGRHGQAARTAPPAEVIVDASHPFYDFEAKYLQEAAATLACPADLPPDVAAEIRALAVRTFDAVGAEGISRVDFFYVPDGVPGAGRVIISEINTMPGFTPHSLYPRMWGVAGVSYTELISELIDLALERPVGLR
ncbi:MAG: D-alanine--D-alanine ligase [Bifidobacteriaceae bacterium]|jgi:D-alanine-D-alanine ligase|nr:D-alanine--D-alanine ligase [Bifidobacteriaceae bacterium]